MIDNNSSIIHNPTEKKTEFVSFIKFTLGNTHSRSFMIPNLSAENVDCKQPQKTQKHMNIKEYSLRTLK